MTVGGSPAPQPPVGLLAELTHRCPLRCAYCSNPLGLTSPRDELSTGVWRRVFGEAAELGVLQVHLSGGEPALRRDLELLVAEARAVGLYSNLITSGQGLDPARVRALAQAGLDHVQLSVQGGRAASADEAAGRRGAHRRKARVAGAVVAEGLPLTINWVVHRGNAGQLAEVLALARRVRASRLEVALAQHAGWARHNYDALLPTRAQHEAVAEQVRQARRELGAALPIDHVPSDQYAARPKACMGGWGRLFLVVAPDGTALPCHDARRIAGLRFTGVGERSLSWIWRESPAFVRFRGTAWMPEPCRSCDRREVDFGGCRCQAHAVTGDAARTDPACALSPDRALLETARGRAVERSSEAVPRRLGGGVHRALPVLRR
ncbi:MAG: pyrroloquinoline quinone biosynthesis protein PqqE [Myxococcota bacterium]